MNNVCFIRESNLFRVNDSFEYNPIIKVLDDYPPDRFSLLLLHNERKDYGENSIYQVYVSPSKKRIGWIFPGQALFSNQHDYAEDQFFLRYAFVAFYKLFEINEDIEEEELSKSVFLLIDFDNTSEITGFDINDYSISLFSYGYSFSGKGNMISSSVDYSSEKKINLKPFSSLLKTKEPFIQGLIKNHIPNSVDPISVFLLFYQLIELLITIVFDDSFSSLLKEIKESENVDLMAKKEKLLESLSEKKRINILFSNRSSVESGNLNELGESCSSFLMHYKQEVPAAIPERLYTVRSFLIHRGYMFDLYGMELIRGINSALCAVVVDLLLSFK